MKDKIGKNVQIQIHRLSNGFLVRPYLNEAHPICYDEEYVFNEFDDMVEFLRIHFPEREE